MSTLVRYYVNKNAQDDGTREVHKVTVCETHAKVHNRIYLGYFSSCHDAVEAAKNHYDNVDGCANCSPSCHKG